MSGVSTAAVKASSSTNPCLYNSLPLGGVELSVSDSSKAETRVFDLHLDQDDAPIAGKLRVVDLNSDPKPTFTALSYCWAQAPGERCTHLPGEATDPATLSKGTITCNSHQIEVPWNCVDALWHLRKAHRRTRKHYLTIWVDTICINQKDDQEKDYQINLMAKIYGSARITYFWLGSGSEATDSAMKYLQKVGAQAYKYPHRFPWSLFDLDLGFLLRLLGSSISPSLGQPCFKGLDEIFQLPWIQRLWTFQEAILPSHAEICCGNKRITWQTMVFALEFLNIHARHPLGLIFPGSYRDWHRLSISWRERKTKRLPWRFASGRFLKFRDLVRALSWNELTTGEALITQNKALLWRIRLTGIITQLLAGLCYNGVFYLCSYKLSNDDSWTIAQVILSCLMLLAAVLIWTLYSNSKQRKLAAIDLQLPSAQSLLEELLRRQSNSEKDKYFALLGIIGDQNTTGLTQQSNIEDIYKQLSLDILRHTDSLDLLLYVPRISNSPFSNSWVVDWRDCSSVWDVCRWRLTSAERGRIKSLLLRVLGEPDMPRDMLEQFSGPEGGLRSEIVENFLVPLGDALSVKGVIIGRLSGSQKPIPYRPIGADSEDVVLLQSIASFQKVAQRIAAEFRSKFFQHLGALLVSGRASSIDMRPGRQWAALFCHSLKNISECNLEDLSANTLRRLLGQTPSYNQVDAAAAWKHHVRLVKFLSEGKMVVFDFRDETPWGTEKIYGGLAPESVQDQDVVAFLHRCPMPMILRPSQRGSFTVVGPSFIPGMMDGEPRTLSIRRLAYPWNWTDLELV